MKWLFAVLVIVNLLVFSVMVVGKSVKEQENEMIARRDEAAKKLAESVSAPAKPLFVSTTEQPQTSAKTTPSYDWINDNGGASENVKEPIEPENDGTRHNRRFHDSSMQTQAQILERMRLPNAKTTRQIQSQAQATGLPVGSKKCVASASITIPSDDYYRIRGLLSSWPHAASNTVERVASTAPKISSTSYAVWMPASADRVAQMRELSSKGFNTISMDGGISIGVRGDKASAMSLLNQLAAAGYSGQLREIKSRTTQSQTATKMRLTFMNLSDQDANAIQGIVGRYGKLQRTRCK